jgi:hypothetical protein
MKMILRKGKFNPSKNDSEYDATLILIPMTKEDKNFIKDLSGHNWNGEIYEMRESDEINNIINKITL